MFDQAWIEISANNNSQLQILQFALSLFLFRIYCDSIQDGLRIAGHQGRTPGFLGATKGSVLVYTFSCSCRSLIHVILVCGIWSSGGNDSYIHVFSLSSIIGRNVNG